MSHVHTWISYLHTWMSHVHTRMSYLHTWMSHVHKCESSHAHIRITVITWTYTHLKTVDVGGVVLRGPQSINESFTSMNKSCNTHTFKVCRHWRKSSLAWTSEYLCVIYTHEWVMSHIWMGHDIPTYLRTFEVGGAVSHGHQSIIKSCYTYRWVMSHTTESWHLCTFKDFRGWRCGLVWTSEYTRIMSYEWRSHVTHEWVMSHTHNQGLSMLEVGSCVHIRVSLSHGTHIDIYILGWMSKVYIHEWVMSHIILVWASEDQWVMWLIHMNQ